MPGTRRRGGLLATAATNRMPRPATAAYAGRSARWGIEFQSFKDAVIWEDRDILTKTGNPYAMFTPYAKVWRTRPIPPPQPSLPPAAGRFPNLASDCPSGDPAELGHPLAQTIFPAGEAAGLKLLDDFLGGAAHRYAEERNLPALAGTSRLSPHLRCGTVGIRTVLAGVAAARAQAAPPQQAGCDAFLTETHLAGVLPANFGQFSPHGGGPLPARIPSRPLAGK